MSWFILMGNPLLGEWIEGMRGSFCRVTEVLQVKVSYFLLISTVCHEKWPRNMEDELQLLVAFHGCVKFAEVYLP